MHSPSMWLPEYNQKLIYTGSTLIGVGIIYLLAANWFMFPKAVQLAIPQLILLLSCLTVVRFTAASIQGRCAIAIAGLMVGLSLTVYGQVYQTGADSFQLFAGWSLLLVPWLYFRQASIWLMFDITLLLAFTLMHEQWLNLPISDYFCYLAFLLFSLNLCAQYFCHSSRLVLVIITSLICCYLNIMLLFDSDKNSSLIFSYLLPIAIALLYYIKRWAPGITLAILAFSINTSAFFIKQVLQHADGINLFFVIAAIVFAWCALLTFMLKKLLPTHIHWNKLPIGFGAWISSILLVIGISIASNGINFIGGLLLLILGAIILKKSPYFFLSQFGFCLLLGGQITFLVWCLFEFSNREYNQLATLISQLILCVYFYFMIRSTFWLSLQFALLLIIANLFYPSLLLYTLFALLIFLALLPNKLEHVRWRAPVLTGLLTLSVLFVVNYFQYTFDEFNETLALFASNLLLRNIAVALLFAGSCFYLNYRKLFMPTNTIVLFLLLSTLLIIVNLYSILAIMISLLIISYYRDTLFNYLAMFALAICLWQFYYSLQLTFIFKGSIIICSGALVILISYFNEKALKGVKP